MKVAIITRKELKDPELTIHIKLETGEYRIRVNYTCPNCAGYGCRIQSCDDHIDLAPEDVAKTLGKESANLVSDILYKVKSS